MKGCAPQTCWIDDYRAFTVNEVALLKLVLLTVMPVPLNVAAAPVTKPVPTTARFWLAAP
jgi:hypothetical protein